MPNFENIATYHLGNGLTVCDKSKEEHGDYKQIAFMCPFRSVQFYGKISDELKKHVLNIASTDNSKISTTQETKVFRLKPNKNYQFKLVGKKYIPKTLSFVENGGKRFFSGSIYTEDEELHKLNCKGFKSYHEAITTAEKYGYQLFDLQ